MDNFCNKKCMHLNKILQKCTKYNRILPCNIELKIFRCNECLEEEKKLEGTNQIGHNK